MIDEKYRIPNFDDDSYNGYGYFIKEKYPNLDMSKRILKKDKDFDGIDFSNMSFYYIEYINNEFIINGVWYSMVISGINQRRYRVSLLISGFGLKEERYADINNIFDDNKYTNISFYDSENRQITEITLSIDPKITIYGNRIQNRIIKIDFKPLPNSLHEYSIIHETFQNLIYFMNFNAPNIVLSNYEYRVRNYIDKELGYIIFRKKEKLLK